MGVAVSPRYRRDHGGSSARPRRSSPASRAGRPTTAAEGGDGAGGYRDPLAQWHPADCSPSGVATLRGRTWVAALRGESLWSVDVSGRGKGRKVRFFHGTLGRVGHVKRAPDGSLWVTTSNGGGQDEVVRITVG